jgi:hypothetical protein
MRKTEITVTVSVSPNATVPRMIRAMPSASSHPLLKFNEAIGSGIEALVSIILSRCVRRLGQTNILSGEISKALVIDKRELVVPTTCNGLRAKHKSEDDLSRIEIHRMLMRSSWTGNIRIVRTRSPARKNFELSSWKREQECMATTLALLDSE